MDTLAIRSRWLSLVLAALVAACGGPAAPAPTAAAAGEWRTFDGSWIASGSRTGLHLGSDRVASLLHLQGSLVLTGNNGLGLGFRVETVELSDTVSGMIGRSVWIDERGERVFSALSAEVPGAGRRITGTFLGGTGRYAGVTGDYEFQWQYVLVSEDGGSVSGRTAGFKGRARLGDQAK